MLNPQSPIVRETQLPKPAGAMDAGDMRDFVPKAVGSENIWVIDDVRAAISKARDVSDEGLILVPGSLYLIGEIKANL